MNSTRPMPGTGFSRFLPGLLFALFSHGTLMGADYHFSSSGDDKTGEGTQAAPWATAAKASALDLEPGDRLLFRAGEIFDVSTETGPLRLDGEDAGSPDRPITVTSYEEGFDLGAIEVQPR